MLGQRLDARRCRRAPSAAPSRPGRRSGRRRRSGGRAPLPRSSPCSSSSASSRSSPHERVAATSSVSISRVVDLGQRCPARRRPGSAGARAPTPTRASCSRCSWRRWPRRRIPSMRRRFSVLKRSRGTNTRQERKRPKVSRRTNSRTRWRSPRCRMPMADPEQLVHGDLEQLVARVGLEDLDERLLVVAAGRERGALEHRVDLAAQDRDLARAGVVGGVGVEAEEAPLADHAARRRRSA